MDANVQVKITDEVLNKLVEKAILDTLTPEARENLVVQAIQALVMKGTGSYDRESAIQRAFNNAVERVAYKVAEERVENDPKVMAEIGAVYTEAWSKITTEGEARTKVVERIAGAFRESLTGSRY